MHPRTHKTVHHRSLWKPWRKGRTQGDFHFAEPPRHNSFAACQSTVSRGTRLRNASEADGPKQHEIPSACVRACMPTPTVPKPERIDGSKADQRKHNPTTNEASDAYLSSRALASAWAAALSSSTRSTAALLVSCRSARAKSSSLVKRFTSSMLSSAFSWRKKPSKSPFVGGREGGSRQWGLAGAGGFGQATRLVFGTQPVSPDLQACRSMGRNKACEACGTRLFRGGIPAILEERRVRRGYGVPHSARYTLVLFEPARAPPLFI